MPSPATRLFDFSESVIRGMTRLANRHQAINLAQGFPDFDPPEELLAALERATRGPHHQYAVTWGAPRFRAALANKITRFAGIQVDPRSTSGSHLRQHGSHDGGDDDRLQSGRQSHCFFTFL